MRRFQKIAYRMAQVQNNPGFLQGPYLTKLCFYTFPIVPPCKIFGWAGAILDQNFLLTQIISLSFSLKKPGLI